MNQLPENSIAKIIIYVSHPVADIIKDEIKINQDRYFVKCGKKNQNNDPDSDSDITFSEYDYASNTHKSFASYYFTKYYQENMCDCCALLRRDCKCICNNCCDNYKNCMMRCFEEPRQKMFYSSSS